MAEFYRTSRAKGSDSGDLTGGGSSAVSEVMGEMFVLVASFSVAAVVYMFVDKTLLSMNFYFHWGNKLYTIRDFCYVETLLTAMAVASPPLANHQHLAEQVDITLTLTLTLTITLPLLSRC